MIRSFAVLAAATIVFCGPAAVADASRAPAASKSGALAVGTGGECANAGATRTKVRDIETRVGIGYARAYTLAPGDSKSRWRNVTRRSELTARYAASASLSAEASGPLARVLRAKAQAKLDVDLRAFGSRYSKTETTVFSSAKNTTDSNQLRVAYKASYFYTGKYRYKYCKYLYPGMNRWETSRGRWHTGRALQSGTLLCFANYPGTVAKAVARVHCT